ncbi:hypothetical protein Q7C_1244 [Methylophaga frappieri]|uniref:Uncharacterized protein n=1 Tax=Methylophaga frappieri (strain ATCC BAA-2434 / DSM 25690 / JAM7) TaxID=754477 RepID=I1YHK1_METFJ|nr:hypothetical protein [Methylophaga frappieri]AFJ02394.1 hypothetical protein Q7C_1244 [Methylophaga frappieri]
MIGIILTLEGLQQFSDNITSETTLWVNPAIADNASQFAFQQAPAAIRVLPQTYPADKEKSVLAALDYVESQTDDPDVFIEYP